MKLTYEQFKKYIEDNGVTEARTTEDLGCVPKGTLIKFGFDDVFISSYEIHLNGQKQYESGVDLSWSITWRNDYKGLFEVEDDYREQKKGLQTEKSKVTDNQKELRISVKTQEEWNAVVKKMLDDPKIGEWNGGGKEIAEELWNDYGEETEIHSNSEDNYRITYSDNFHTNIPPQSAQEYLGYDPNEKLTDLSRSTVTTVDEGIGVGSQDWYGKNIDECIEKMETYLREESIKNKLYISFNQLTKPKGNKYMSIISNAFKSKENKALEHFGLGTTETLSERGRQEFIDFLWETLKEEKKAFLSKMVEAYKEDKE